MFDNSLTIFSVPSKACFNRGRTNSLFVEKRKDTQVMTSCLPCPMIFAGLLASKDCPPGMTSPPKEIEVPCPKLIEAPCPSEIEAPPEDIFNCLVSFLI